jgi:hypothetical protein
MKYVVDANIILSGLIADSMTRRLLVELEDGLLTPAYVYDEVGAYTEMVSEKAGLSPAAVEELMSCCSSGSTSCRARWSSSPSRRPHGSCGTPTPTTRSTWRPRSSATPPVERRQRLRRAGCRPGRENRRHRRAIRIAVAHSHGAGLVALEHTVC